MSGKVIMLAAGGTGGHVFTAQSIAEECKDNDLTPVIMTDERGIRFLQENKDYTVLVNPFKRGGGLKKIFSFLSNLYRSFQLIRHYKPSVVIGFGGYPAFSLVFIAALLRIPTLIHEQNAVLGKANKFLSYLTKYVLCGFEQTQGIPGCAQSIYTGNPVRNDIKEAAIGYPPLIEPYKIFIVGGSQGAKVFSDILPKAFALYKKKKGVFPFKITQQVRQEFMEQTQQFYKASGIEVELKPFFTDMGAQLSQSHFVIARSGAGTVAELETLRRPSLLVPYALAIHNHQYFNALSFEKKGGGWVIKENDLTEDKVYELLEEIVKNPSILQDKYDVLASIPHKQPAQEFMQIIKHFL